MRPEYEGEYVAYVSGRLARLHRAAYLLCGDADRAHDVVQATALALYLHWRRVRAADNVDGYVHRVLVRQFLNTRRLAWARVLLLDTLPDRADVPAPSVEDRDLLAAAMARLPVGQRTALVLRFYEDLSIEQTAAVMGCSTGNVKSQTSRGLAAIREVLAGRIEGVTNGR